ncbi:MAG: LacI family DNA-binding transcriptional regulator [Dehalococcoidia bacterium]|nr:LacI family DNA-binding transcriptional regulator [Dehalococcoidia bacterium]
MVSRTGPNTTRSGERDRGRRRTAYRIVPAKTSEFPMSAVMTETTNAEIARKAGLSEATISRIISGQRFLSRRSAESLMEAVGAKDLGELSRFIEERRKRAA